MVEMRGVDLLCGAGRVAALECPRHSIHYRSRSTPAIQKQSPPDGRTSFLVEMRGVDLPCGAGHLGLQGAPGALPSALVFESQREIPQM